MPDRLPYASTIDSNLSVDGFRFLHFLVERRFNGSWVKYVCAGTEWRSYKLDVEKQSREYFS